MALFSHIALSSNFVKGQSPTCRKSLHFLIGVSILFRKLFLSRLHIEVLAFEVRFPTALDAV
jgi:hypothetical protein